MQTRCYLILYLHMHQPYYKNPRTGEYLLPWVRLHALRNYADIPTLQEKYPGVAVTYNLVPSLVEQLLDYANGATDEFERVSNKAAEELSDAEKRFLLSNFFQLNRLTQIDSVDRYRELLELKGSSTRDVSEKALNSFDARKYRDLQVHFNLAWSGWLLREKPQVSVLIKKGRNYSEEEKLALLTAQREFLPSILEPYKRLLAAEACELSTSPFYHPILPLLCDTNSAHEAAPELLLPSQRFQFPQDAAGQIKAGIDFHTSIFGARPEGIWPSEGAISAQACELIAQAGFRWAASDRTTLARTLDFRVSDLKAENLYTPYQLHTKNGELALFFRDTELSDLPAFVYQNWSAEKAADDFIARLEVISKEAPVDQIPVVSVILDGENAWAGYPDNGRAFLEALFERLQGCGWLETVTPSQALDTKSVKPRKLPKVVAGSWIYGTLTTWIGHPEKNSGWEVLATARAELEKALQTNSADDKNLDAAKKETMIAEGSDWFWWYGEDHVTSYAAEFDTLFREHVMGVYRNLNSKPPENLQQPIKQVEVKTEIQQPVRLISPKLNGKDTSYVDWVNAGHYYALGGAGMMHHTSSLLEWIYFGYDKKNFYFRFDGREPFSKKMLDGCSLCIYITSPASAAILYDLNSDKPPSYVVGKDSQNLKYYGADQIIEMAVPWRLLDAKENDVLAFYVVVKHGENDLERHPRSGVIEVQLLVDELSGINWSA